MEQYLENLKKQNEQERRMILEKDASNFIALIGDVTGLVVNHYTELMRIEMMCALMKNK